MLKFHKNNFKATKKLMKQNAESTSLCNSKHSEESQKNNLSLRENFVKQNFCGKPPIEKLQNLQGGLPRRFCESARNDGLYFYKTTTYAILCVSFLICVFNPYALYATDITQFDSTQTLPTLCALFGAFLISSFIAIYLISFIPKRFAKIPAFIFSLTLFIGLVYSFILVGDYGAMDHFVLQKTPFDDRDALIAKAREFVAMVAVGAIFIAFALKRLLYLWQIIFITLFIVSGVNATNITLKRLDSASFAESNVNSTHSAPPPFALRRI